MGLALCFFPLRKYNIYKLPRSLFRNGTPLHEHQSERPEGITGFLQIIRAENNWQEKLCPRRAGGDACQQGHKAAVEPDALF